MRLFKAKKVNTKSLTKIRKIIERKADNLCQRRKITDNILRFGEPMNTT